MRGALALSLLVVLLLPFPSVAEEAPGVELEVRPLRGARADVAALLMLGADSGSLLAGALASPRPAGVDFWMELDGPRLLAEAGPEPPSSLELYAYALTSGGELVGTLARRVRLGGADLGAGRLRLAARLDLEPGDYVLRVLAREPASQRFALRVLEITVPAGDVASGEPPLPPGDGAWIVTADGGASVVSEEPAARPEAVDLEEERRGARRVAAIASAYRGVLGRLASGTIDEAVAELRHVEGQAFDGHDDRSRSQGWVLEAEERVAERLAAHDPEALVPLLVLHLEAHDRHLEEGVVDPFVVGTARERVLELARLYARSSESDQAPALASSALARLGVALERTRLPIAAGRMLEEAAQLDATNAPVLLDLAYLYERRGQHRAAVDVLRRLVAVAPGSEEGRVRLALCLGRLGETAEAERILRQVIADGRSAWLLAIAHEELGRLLLAVGRTSEAVELLRTAVARLPSEQRLYVALAYALDKSGERRRGYEVIESIPVAAAGTSARKLYSRRPHAQDPNAGALVRHGTARLPLLMLALAATGEEG